MASGKKNWIQCSYQDRRNQMLIVVMVYRTGKNMLAK